jgi:hypothetical protein
VIRVKRLVLLLTTLAVLVMSGAPALAADVTEVVNGIRDDGVFVESGASTSDAEIGALVAEARNDGENLSIVVLSEEPLSGAVTFADAVVDRVGARLVIVIAPESIGYAGTGVVYTVDELENALDVAFDSDGDDGDFARNIVETLTGRSAAVPDPVPAGSSSGGGSGFLIFVVIIVVLVGGFFWLRSRSSKQKAVADQSRVDAARAEVQKRIDDVANDLLDMEDEVRQADNSRADRFYNEAGETYREVSEAFATANAPQDLIDLSNSLDRAIWQLDTAEAILDGTELPERPEPRSLAREPEPAQRVDTSKLPSSTYQRRSTRRSSYGSGSSMMETLLQLGLAYAAGRSRRSPSSRAAPSGRSAPSGGGLGGLFPGRGSSSRSSGSSSSSRRSSSSQKGTGGRVRGGRSRRRG